MTWSDVSITNTSPIFDCCAGLGCYQAFIPRSIPVDSSPTSDFYTSINELNLFPQSSQNIGFDSKQEFRANAMDLFQGPIRDDYFSEKNLSSFNSPTVECLPLLPDSSFPVQNHVSNTMDCIMFSQTFDEPMPSLQDSMSVRSQYSPEFIACPLFLDSLKSCNQENLPLSPKSKHNSDKPISSKRKQEIPKRSKKLIKHCSQGLPENTILLPSSAKKCDFEGCGKKFVRQEHLKRHQRTHYSSESFKCQFCDRSFSRFDNLLAHMKLHDKRDTDRPNRRTQYFKEAAKVIENMSRKRQKTTCSKKNTNTEREQTEI
ncbi:hypothetical protein Golomagni_01472 [Golovinomyces magnicellulatus]|nr:hypothetical protein Golomagni_01472 [Golovinomyces magnicellulatus]